MEAVIAKGDISKLSPMERADYYRRTCESMGLNPLTQPFQYITLNGKLTLYATRTATDQLRKINSVTLKVVSEETTTDGLRVVRVRASTPDGREDEEIGAVNVAGLKADALANAYMKALTKAKRRATLSICGLGWLDESEIETIPAARRVPVSSYVPDDEPVIDVEEAEYTQPSIDVVAHDNTDVRDAQLEAYQASMEESPEWTKDIHDAETLGDLTHLQELMKQAGVTGKEFPSLLRYYVARSNRIKLDAAKVTRAAAA
jgi:hypothetical protein